MNIEGIIDSKLKIDKDNYYKLVKLYGKERLSTLIDKYIKDSLEIDFSRENQTRLWDRFGYYLACQEKTVFEDISLSKIKKKGKRNRNFTLEEEKRCGYCLLVKPYINILNDNGKISIEQIFASINSVSNRDYILSKLEYMYNNISRTSYIDTEIKNFINNYKKLCLKEELPKINYDGDLINSQELLEQVDMYVRYSIAHDKMLIGNLAIIDNVINNRAYLLEKYDYDELYQNGYFGVVRAVENYDVRYGDSFIASACRWAISYIQKNIKFDLFSANISYGATSLIKQINKEDEISLVSNGRILTDDELSLNLGISVDKIREARFAQEQFSNFYLDDLEVNDSLENAYWDISKELNFNDKIDDDELCTWEEVISDYSCFSSEIENFDFYKYVLKVMDEKLTEKEKRILLMRAYGMTLDVIGNNFGISRERVRQLEERGIKKVRRNPGMYKLLNKERVSL